MKNPNDNMLLRIAQGDACAVAVEYVRREKYPDLFEEVLKLEKYQEHPTYHALAPGMYTDDTQMSIAVSELLLADESLTVDRFRERFFLVFKRDPRDGYSRGFQKLLNECKTVDELKERLVPNSTKNGAAMRSVPFGVLASPRDAMHLAKLQAAVTHATRDGELTAQAVALMSHFTLHTDIPFSEMMDWCSQYLPEVFDEFWHDWDGYVADRTSEGGFDVGMNTVWAVTTLLQREKSLIDILRKTIEWGGDTDSVCAIAWGIASARYQDEQLPEFLEKDLEWDGNYGTSFLKTLGNDLMRKYVHH